MALLGLVKSASRLQEEQRHFNEVVLEFLGLAFTPGSLVEVSGTSASGVELENLLWICCGGDIEKAFMAVDSAKKNFQFLFDKTII